MRCYEKAIGQLTGLDVPTFKAFAPLAAYLDKNGWELAVWELDPPQPLQKIAVEMYGYAIVSQQLPSGIIHATLTYYGIIPKQSGRQLVKPSMPVVLVTTINPKECNENQSTENGDENDGPIRSIVC